MWKYNKLFQSFFQIVPYSELYEGNLIVQSSLVALKHLLDLLMSDLLIFSVMWQDIVLTRVGLPNYYNAKKTWHQIDAVKKY